MTSRIQTSIVFNVKVSNSSSSGRISSYSEIRMDGWRIVLVTQRERQKDRERDRRSANALIRPRASFYDVGLSKTVPIDIQVVHTYIQYRYPLYLSRANSDDKTQTSETLKSIVFVIPMTLSSLSSSLFLSLSLVAVAWAVDRGIASPQGSLTLVLLFGGVLLKRP